LEDDDFELEKRRKLNDFMVKKGEVF
jgi:hypothetical protein